MTGKTVYFEDCFRYHGDLVDGDMNVGDLVEAKAKRFEHLLSRPFGDYIMNDFLAQATKQYRVATTRGVGLKWYFAEKSVSDDVRQRFKDGGLGTIVVSHMPPRSPR